VETALERRPHRAVIVATAPQHVRSLIGVLSNLTEPLNRLSALAYRPIVTVYLHYPVQVRMSAPMLGLCARHGQWLFDRSRICGQDGLVSVVISARARAERLPHEILASRVHEEIAPLLGITQAPDWVQVIEEKRATFACTPNLQRPTSRTGLPGLYLAGDYTSGDYPATIEAAVRSGQACARMTHEWLRA
jgi:predicted NAD/FAD-dependent oxidoreductase